MHNNDINTKNIQHLKNLNLNKINFIFKRFFVFSFLGIISYFLPFELFYAFDFGFIFEIISLTLTAFSFFNLNTKKNKLAKLEIIIALISLCLLLAYDFFYLLKDLKFVISEFFLWLLTFDYYFYYFTPVLIDFNLLIQIIFLIKILYLLKMDKKDLLNNASFYEKL